MWVRVSWHVLYGSELLLPCPLACFLLLLAAVLRASAQQPQPPRDPCLALQSSYSTAHTGCRVGGSCGEVVCSYPGVILNGSRLSVQRCVDPLLVTLEVEGADSAHAWSHTFSVAERQTSCSWDIPSGDTVLASYGRNASHLSFQV